MGPAAGSSPRMQPSHWRRNNCRTSWTLLHGTRSLALQVWLAGQFCCTLCRMGAPAWRDPIFLAELRRRLGVPDAARDTWCPRCDGILDAHSHHAGMCLAGGDRTRRHHAARGLVAAWATCAGLAPELEKAELLLPQWPDDARLALRRLADVYLPAFEGAPTALVLAITGRLRSESLAEAGRHALAASGVYAHLKKSHLNTAQLCTAQGVRFRPMVAESTGAWDSEASQILQLIARGVSAREGRHPAATQATLLEELSVAIRSCDGQCSVAGLFWLLQPWMPPKQSWPLPQISENSMTSLSEPDLC